MAKIARKGSTNLWNRLITGLFGRLKAGLFDKLSTRKRTYTIKDSRIKQNIRILVITDVHGNYRALDAILRKVKDEESRTGTKVDVIYFGGDIFDSVNDKNNDIIRDIILSIAEEKKVVMAIGNHDLVYFVKKLFGKKETAIKDAKEAAMLEELRKHPNIEIADTPIRKMTIMHGFLGEGIEYNNVNYPAKYYERGELFSDAVMMNLASLKDCIEQQNPCITKVELANRLINHIEEDIDFGQYAQPKSEVLDMMVQDLLNAFETNDYFKTNEEPSVEDLEEEYKPLEAIPSEEFAPAKKPHRAINTLSPFQRRGIYEKSTQEEYMPIEVEPYEASEIDKATRVKIDGKEYAVTYKDNNIILKPIECDDVVGEWINPEQSDQIVIPITKNGKPQDVEPRDETWGAGILERTIEIGGKKYRYSTDQNGDTALFPISNGEGMVELVDINTNNIIVIPKVEEKSQPKDEVIAENAELAQSFKVLFAHSPKHLVQKLPKSKYHTGAKVGAARNPMSQYVADYEEDLVICGHYHGGLVPDCFRRCYEHFWGIVGPYSKFGKKIDPCSGLYRLDNGKNAIISAGVTAIAPSSGLGIFAKNAAIGRFFNKLFKANYEIVDLEYGTPSVEITEMVEETLKLESRAQIEKRRSI